MRAILKAELRKAAHTAVVVSLVVCVPIIYMALYQITAH